MTTNPAPAAQGLRSGEPSLLDQIKGERDERGRFKVTHWPKPRISNPHFLTEELAGFLATKKDKPE